MSNPTPTVNIPLVGPFPAKTYQHTDFDPWPFSVGFVHRSGGGESLLARY